MSLPVAARPSAARACPAAATTTASAAVPAAGVGPALSPAAFSIIARLLEARSGLSLGPDKVYLLETRLGPVLHRHGIADLVALAGRLNAPSEALVGDVVEAMTINETFFFRDGKPFDHLRDVVLPALHAARPPGRPFRFWSAASSSGQEAYSLAILAAEQRDRIGGRAVEIVGTDISRAQVSRARAGIYTHFEAQRGLPIQSLVRHFDRHADGWQVKPELRATVRFQTFNLLDDFAPLGRFDVIFCRNVLIYFEAPLKAAILDRMAARIAPDGALYLGGAETIFGITERFSRAPSDACCRLATSKST